MNQSDLLACFDEYLAARGKRPIGAAPDSYPGVQRGGRLVVNTLYLQPAEAERQFARFYAHADQSGAWSFYQLQLAPQPDPRLSELKFFIW